MLRIIGACFSLLSLGFAMGFSPTLYAVVLHLLTRSANTSAMLLFLLAGLVAGATLLALVFQAVDPESVEGVLRGRVEDAVVHRGVDLVAGVAFVVAGAVVGRRAHTHRRPPPQPRPPADYPRRMFLIGFANTVIGVSGIATMYLTARVVRGVSHDDVVRLAAYGVFLVALVGPYVLVAWAWDRFPALASRLTAGYTWVTARDPRPWVAALLLLIGLFFLGYGFSHDYA